ncbi:MAG: hypothetical protein MO846_00940 [Candidatus Devosia symbiotica]|nr:hypothetical protein [Candidatus Devosia symbiotica]
MSTISGIGAQSASQLTRTVFRPPSFASLDSNRDDSLTLDEFKLLAPKGALNVQANKRREVLFLAMDTNGDGSFTSNEKDIFDKKIADQR